MENKNKIFEDNNILSKLDLSNKELMGEGYVSKGYKVKVKNENKIEYIILVGLINDSYQCYKDSYDNLIFIYNNGNPLIKSIKIPIDDLNLIKPNNEFKYGCLIYKNIPGVIIKENIINKINIENITNSISNFLIELYNIKIKEDFSISEFKEKKLNYFNEITLTFKNYLNNKNYKYDKNKLLQFKEEYKNYLKEFNEPHYIHGDLWEENMIITEDYQNLSGIIDFDDFGIGDNALDFANLSDFGYDFINIVIQKCSSIINNVNVNDFIIKIKMYEKWVFLNNFFYLYQNYKNDCRLEQIIEEMKELNFI